MRKPYIVDTPPIIEIDTLSHRQADRIERFIDVERVDIRTVRIRANDILSAFERAWLAVEVADFEAGAWNQ
jgi:D-aminopeptidase